MSTRNEAYLHARVSVMKGRLLKPEQTEAMINLAVSDLHSQNSSARLQELFLSGTNSSANTLEQRILSSVLDDCQILARPLKGNERDFLIHWVLRLELSNLKAILRGKLAGRSIQSIRADLLDAGAFATLPVEQLLRTEDFSELLRQLDTTPYADIARQARAAFESEHDLFAVDATVDRRYFNSLLTRAMRIENRQGHLFRELMASIIDRVNLVWLLRYRFVYQLPPPQTFYLLVPSRSHLNSDRLAALVKLESFEEVLAALPMSLRTELGGLPNIFEVTQHLESRTYAAAHRVLQHAPHSLARAFAYLVMREYDLRKIRIIIKSQQLKLAPDIVRYTLGIAAAAEPAH